MGAFSLSLDASDLCGIRQFPLAERAREAGSVDSGQVCSHRRHHAIQEKGNSRDKTVERPRDSQRAPFTEEMKRRGGWAPPRVASSSLYGSFLRNTIEAGQLSALED